MNPLVRIREERGWDRRAAAAAMDVSYTDVAQVEGGYFRRLPRRVCVGLERMGLDVESIQGDYHTWLAERGKEILCGQRT